MSDNRRIPWSDPRRDGTGDWVTRAQWDALGRSVYTPVETTDTPEIRDKYGKFESIDPARFTKWNRYSAERLKVLEYLKRKKDNENTNRD